MEIKRTVYLDLDGVMADFEQHYENLFSHRHNSVGDGIMWKNIHSREDWWHTMPRMPTFEYLWDNIKQYNPIILTGCPPQNYDRAVAGKIKWCLQHFGEDVPVITCRSKDKPLHMKNEGDILIDDLDKNCIKWNDAGGIAVKFSPDNIEEVIKIIHELMKD